MGNDIFRCDCPFIGHKLLNIEFPASIQFIPISHFQTGTTVIPFSVPSSSYVISRHFQSLCALAYFTDGGMIAVGISDKTRRIEGVDRMCRELSAIGTKEPQYHLVAFIMKASVWANVLEEGQENAVIEQKRPDIDQKSDQKSDQIKMFLELIKEKLQISRS